MKLLALDTSTTYLSLALSLETETLVFHECVAQKHAERTLPEVSRLLAEAGFALSSLDGIVFGQGPGSFTGLRIACGVAQGLAYSADLPVTAIPTLDNLAWQAGDGLVQVCFDARMQQVYSALYRVGPDWERLSPIAVVSPEDVSLPEGVSMLAGDGFDSYPQLLADARQRLPLSPHSRPHAAAYIRLAESGRYPARHPREAELLYVRNKVALTSIEQQQARNR
ncbi:tRNA (adenosine(37)-N6)-threonylcarbamoyltransferase complex dimerization subunit type 1 TsaB [Chromobacterium piscinae]|uniref:tRNA (Adenosine(37)-N6)-threonylcarbamoyltransferase complex dimerization subunit type 1 TsaB n=1 Tax=Chromobacterium piscinae TaxID=686831 RepID=A0ABV0H1Y0_9NEIS|nr:tRNA (adenosine(37)-N6)-threonylcarbamoyltransferase complex dimerization subunit type 1 TsaB [Chromobacterium piscinae]MBX9295381.1 tRNA (adenosine(37)-N6)-threonylcarbamoyltransferase complex dimerization subunit type 1 TsaB [Chromobacterium vaccinii]MBX9347332.1 tRNA (adenosine(37)-N6)-threonylcarbamoyltransferase complex dimerization subunit type 1 TsaB [Chromobacterium vaccinii]MBX9356390.1 tRNA (adenosine(37)-N6)-threonylcarbamoyltransferase complex dimerization subunit type 1 TsaB [Chr